MKFFGGKRFMEKDSGEPAESAKEIIVKAAIPLGAGAESAYDALIESVGEARVVLLGEASHGTHDFYRARAQITQRLISEKGFNAVAVEADFPDAFRVNRFVRGAGNDKTAEEALGEFQRFPAWMWRNKDVVDFVESLRSHNDNLPADSSKVGFYGIDLYSLHASIEAVLNYLEKTDPEGLQRARERYSCFEDFGEDTQTYGYSTGLGYADSCEDEVVSQLLELNRRAGELAEKDGGEDFFYAEQNARLVKNAEQYYRLMYRSDVSSWNLRDRHMAETIVALENHLLNKEGNAKIVVWAHNSHLGDARATEMTRRGEWNVGQLAREHYGREAFLVGFTTYAGTVTAATNWGGEAELKRVRPGLKNSVEAIFHSTELENFLLLMPDDSAVKNLLRKPLLERAIGVIYRPETERQSHYFTARVAEQFDAVIHFDETRAVEPLERNSKWDAGAEFEAFPTGL
jgi:erythromycin esterase-like protein